MIIKFKRIYSFWIELLAMMVISLFAYEFLGMFLYSVISDSFKASMYSYMYVRPLFELIILLYFVLRNVFNGHSVLQMMFGIKFDYNNKRQLILKNIIDLVTLPISFLTVLFLNKSIGDYVCRVRVSEIENTTKKSSDSFFYIMIAWFTVMPIIFFLAFNWRINKSEQEFRFHLNNTQTIKDNVGHIKDFSFNDKFFWAQYDKDGEYTGAKVKNTEGQVFKIKIYRNRDDNGFDYFVINGEKYDYEIEKFNLSDYEKFFKDFEDDIKVSEITNEKEALIAASDALKVKYPGGVSGYKGTEVFYDSETDTYMIHYVSSINYDTLGGDCNIIIESNGNVLGIWQGE